MSKMQSFYAWLFGPSAPADTEQAQLAQLTQVSPEQMGVFKADLDWETWTPSEPAPLAAVSA